MRDIGEILARKTQHAILVAPDRIERTKHIDRLSKLPERHALVARLLSCQKLKDLRRRIRIEIEIVLVAFKKFGEIESALRLFDIALFQPQQIGEMVQPIALRRLNAHRASAELLLYVGGQLLHLFLILRRLIGARRRVRLILPLRSCLVPLPLRRRLRCRPRVLLLLAAEELRVARFADGKRCEEEPRLLAEKALVCPCFLFKILAAALLIRLFSHALLRSLLMLRLERLVFFHPLLLRLGAGDLLDLRILFPAPLRAALEPFERGLKFLLCRLISIFFHGA